jgi:uncharacterized alkaline shock family protein YloU
MERKGKRLMMSELSASFAPARSPSSAGDGEGEDHGEGTIRISEDVIAAIVRKSALEIPGVARFGTSTLAGGLAEMIGRKTRDSSIVVDLDAGQVAVSVNLVLAFGCRIPEVAATVREAIRKSVEEMTGMRVTRVNVTIQNLEDAPKPSDPPLPGFAGDRG